MVVLIHQTIGDKNQQQFAGVEGVQWEGREGDSVVHLGGTWSESFLQSLADNRSQHGGRKLAKVVKCSRC